MHDGCPFCAPDPERTWMENTNGIVLWDAFPVSEGHTLIIPRQHVGSVYLLPPAEQVALWTLVADARQRLQEWRLLLVA